MWAKTITGQGLTDATLPGNPLASFSMAYLYYCDGASFASGREDPVPYNGTHSLHFRGRDILVSLIGCAFSRGTVSRASDGDASRAAPEAPPPAPTTNPAPKSAQDEILATLLDPKGPYRMDRAEQVVLGGHSAGGMATFHAADHVADTLSAAGLGSASFVGMPDAGFFLPDVPDADGNFSYRAEMQSIFALSNASAGVHPACLAHWAAQGEAWRCMFPRYEAPFIRSRLFLVQSQYDSWQMDNVVHLGCDPPKEGSCSEAQLKRFQSFRDSMRADLAAAGILPPGPNRAIWTDACIAHSQGYYGHYFTNDHWRVGGQTIAETMGAVTVGGTVWPGNTSEIDDVRWPHNSPCADAGV